MGKGALGARSRLLMVNGAASSASITRLLSPPSRIYASPASFCCAAAPPAGIPSSPMPALPVCLPAGCLPAGCLQLVVTA